MKKEWTGGGGKVPMLDVGLDLCRRDERKV